MRYKTIQDFVEAEHPDAWKSGKWGACMFDFDTLENLKASEPNGVLVDTIAGEYFFWLNT